MTETKSVARRGFVGSILVALSGAPAVADNIALDSMPEGTDSGWLAWAIRKWGEDEIATHITALIAEGGFTIRALKTRLNRVGQKTRRATFRRKNAERHQDTILWSGVLSLDAEMLLSGSGDNDYDGRNRPRKVVKSYTAEPLEITDYSAGVQAVHDVPVGTRTVIDIRRQLGSIASAELVETIGRPMRLHIWTRSGTPYLDASATLNRVFGTRLHIERSHA